MAFKVIFEIGPIVDYLSSTRKLKDLWGGSYLFSYLMGKVAKFILEEENIVIDEINHRTKKQIDDVIIKPLISDDSLFKSILLDKKPQPKVGSIPDQLQCIIKNPNTPKNVKRKFSIELENLYGVAKSFYSNQSFNDELAFEQLSYFSLFYTISNDSNSFNDTDMSAIAARGAIQSFDHWNDTANTCLQKSEKCSLCGNHKKIITLPPFNEVGKAEHLCAICLLKRELFRSFFSGKLYEAFPSTPAIAAFVPKLMIKNCADLFADELSRFIEKQIDNSASDAIEADIVLEDLIEEDKNELAAIRLSGELKNSADYLSYRLYFSDTTAGRDIQSALKSVIKKYPNDLRSIYDFLELDSLQFPLTPWIKRGHFAIVAADGDDMGMIFSEAQGEGNASQISDALISYTRKTEQLFEKYGGKLIYCGGEDTLGIIHPIMLIKLAQDLQTAFNETVGNLMTRDVTISIGAMICPQKYPLSLAIKSAHEMLDAKAKSIPGKASLAIKLIKGNSEACTLFSKVKSIDNSQIDLELIRSLLNQNIPRGFVYKLNEQLEILKKTLSTVDEIEKYLKFQYEKTRTNNIEWPSELSGLCRRTNRLHDESFDLESIVNILYFVRYLQGDK